MSDDNGPMQEEPKGPPSLDAFDVWNSLPEFDALAEAPGPPVYSEPVTLRPSSPVTAPKGAPVELPYALIYPSKPGGTGNGHVVLVQANGELTCSCWPALRSPRGCHRMVAARQLLGLPPVD